MASNIGVQINPRDVILELIKDSKDEEKSPENLRVIRFADVMDIVLYYISLQPDLHKIAKIDQYKFRALLRGAWNEWRKTAIKSWGYKRYEYPFNSGKMQEAYNFYQVDCAWSSGSPDTEESTLGTAEYYANIYPGFFRHESLLSFFSYSKGLLDEAGNWPLYRNHIERFIFPKWRRRAQKKKLESALRLAEIVCVRMREAER